MKNIKLVQLIAVIYTPALYLYSPALLANHNTCTSSDDGGDIFKPISECWYASGALSYSRLDPDARTAGWRVTDDSDTGWSIAGGWRFSPKLFAEFKYADQGEAKISNTVFAATIDYNSSSLMLGYDVFSISDSLNVFVKAGLASIDSSVSGNSSVSVNKSNSIDLAGGAGLEYRWKSSWFSRFTTDIYSQDLQTAEITIGRYFGKSKAASKTIDSSTRSDPPPSDNSQQNEINKPEIASTETAKNVEVLESQPAAVIHAPVKAGSAINNPEPKREEPKAPEVQKPKAQLSECAKLEGIMENIQFPSNSSYMKPSGKEQLKEYAGLVKQFPDTQILISAHTDSDGDDNYNKFISDRRAKRVADYLIALGVDATQLTSEGAGESRPIANNDTEEGRAANRRVEFKILSSESCSK